MLGPRPVGWWASLRSAPMGEVEATRLGEPIDPGS